MLTIFTLLCANFHDGEIFSGVLKTASEKDISDAYTALSESYDPENEESANLFKDVTLAYETLIDAAKRDEYDNPASSSSRQRRWSIG